MKFKFLKQLKIYLNKFDIQLLNVFLCTSLLLNIYLGYFLYQTFQELNILSINSLELSLKNKELLKQIESLKVVEISNPKEIILNNEVFSAVENSSNSSINNILGGCGLFLLSICLFYYGCSFFGGGGDDFKSTNLATSNLNNSVSHDKSFSLDVKPSISEIPGIDRVVREPFPIYNPKMTFSPEELKKLTDEDFLDAIGQMSDIAKDLF